MKQMMFSKVLRVVACVPALCASVPTFGVADQGRLWQAINGQGCLAHDYRRGGKEWGVAARAEAQWRHPWEAVVIFVTRVSLTN